MHRKDFPGVAVRIGEPQLVLPREAAGDVLLDFLQNALRLQALFPGATFKRMTGTQDPTVNNGATVGPTANVPGRDALILLNAN